MTNKKTIVGIHQSGPIASAALIRDGQLLAAAPEERFSRQKHDRSFPHRAIDFCLKSAGLALTDVDHFAIAWNAGESAALKYRAGFSDWMRYPGEWLASVPNHILSRMDGSVVATESTFDRGIGVSPTSIHFVDHHQCHARMAYEYSDFDDCAILIADGWSEQKVTTWYHANKGQLKLVKSQVFPQSLGGFYATLTDYLGYKPFNDEWRVMGMAAYGNAANVPEMRELIELAANGDYELNLKYFDFYNFDRPRFFGPALEKLLGPARKGGELTDRHFDIAAATQHLFEIVMSHILTAFHKSSGCDRLALGGGVAMNCLYNGKVLAQTPFKQCYISFAPDDSGNSIGAAMDLSRKLGVPVRDLVQTSSLGQEFTDDQIRESLERYKVKGRFVQNIARETAQLISQQKIVGWFQGKSEFGQRALGHRSIFALPTNSKMKDLVNHSIKYRESYRPFAPMLLQSKVRDFFETEDHDPVRFMEKAFVFSDSVRDLVPAVVHADGTGRLQTVDPDSEPLVADLLREVEQLCDCPMLLNTSFNLNGEPVVNSPEDAIRTFYTSGLDVLVMGSYIVEK